MVTENLKISPNRKKKLDTYKMMCQEYKQLIKGGAMKMTALNFIMDKYSITQGTFYTYWRKYGK